MDEEEIVISCYVYTKNAEHAIKAAEAFTRLATGLILDGINVSVSMFKGNEETELEL